MADWSLIESTLETWVENLTSLPTHWRGRPRAPDFSNAGYVLLSISGIRTLGVDEVYATYDDTQPAGSEYRFYQRGQRTFTFGIQVRTQRQSVDNDAKHFTSIINNALRMPISTVAVLYAADIAIDQVLSETVVEDEIDGRDMSISQLDIRMNARAVAEDTPVGYIATIKDAELEDGDGNVIWTGDIVIG